MDGSSTRASLSTVPRPRLTIRGPGLMVVLGCLAIGGFLWAAFGAETFAAMIAAGVSLCF